MNLRRSALSLLVLPLLLQMESASAATVRGPEDLKPTAEHQETYWKILVRLDYVHYRSLELDDQFSSKLLDRYIAALDPSRWFFLASDVQEFDRLRDRLDEVVQEGDLEAPFAIFRRFQERRMSRYQYLQGLLESDFESLKFDTEEVLLADREEAAWCLDQEEIDDLWRRRFKNDVLSLRLADQAGDEIQETLAKRYRDQLHRVEQITSDDVFRVFCNTLTAMYGPHTEYYPPLQAENFDISMSLSFEGIGALLGSDGEYVTIQRIIPGGPAEAGAELQPGDRITAVGQGLEGEEVNVVGWRTDEVVKLIRGEKGTTVRLIVLPANQADTSVTATIAIVRDQVKLEESEAQSKVLEVPSDDGNVVKVGVIELPAFYVDFDGARRREKDFKSSTRDVRRLIEELKKQDIDGLLMDLRGNSGGSLTEAHDLVGLFLGEVPVVQVRSSRGDIEVLGASSSKIWDGPMAVVVDRLSASASEIFAAAIQDTGRGLVIGSQTFGKGTVQNLLPIDEGQLKVTLAKFYRLSGGSTQHRGVVPDIEFPSLYDPEVVGESSLDDPLPWDRVEPVSHPEDRQAQQMAPALQVRSRERTSGDPEFIYLVERLRYYKEGRETTTLDLSEEARRAQRVEDETIQLEMENRRRVALGLEQVNTWEELRDTSLDPEEVHPFVREAAQILVDSIRLRT